MIKAPANILAAILFLAISFPVLGFDKEEKSAIASIKAGDLATLKSYLETHPGVNCEFSDGKTGLYYSIVYDRFNIAFFLLSQGADPDFMVSGITTLKWAIKYGRERIARLLLEFGADVNRPDEKLKTPLFYAAEINNFDLCKILIDRGADPSHTNGNGKRASDLAFNYEDLHLYKYLKFMEDQIINKDSVPSMTDGPYIFREEDDQLVLTYFEHDQGKNLTRKIEKTILTASEDTIVNGIGWDTNSYHIQRRFTPAEIDA
ncbi:MAG: ankyrin repeat domain-containing protein, partial [Bacteroidales bacterium]|nr:ankyrin repeat domain-containing protein [Bacteroidales bacterium]